MRRTLILTAAFASIFVLLRPAATMAAPSPAADGAEQVWLSDLDAAVAEARAEDALIVVDLYADWCGWCKKIEAEVFPTQTFRSFAADKVLLRVDVEDGGEGTALQARYEAFNLPTTLILDSDMIQVGKISGFSPAEMLVERFQVEITAWDRIVSRYPQVLASGTESLRRSLAQELHRRADGERAAALYAKILEGSGRQLLDAPWLYYLQADAHRLAGDFDAAGRAATRAMDLNHDQALREKLDLLAYRIAQDAGDCQGAKSTLQAFLDRNPESQFRRQLARTLKALEQGSEGICA